MPWIWTPELPEFSSNDVFPLSWKNIMDAYSCTGAVDCTSVCPVEITVEIIAWKVLMDIRDR